MNNRESRRYDMFARVTTFGKDNAADFAAGSEAAKHFASLGQIVTDLGTASAGQQAGGATAKSVLLDALRLDLQNIARTARAIAQDAPGFADKFAPPDNHGQQALTTAATAYLTELRQPGVAAQFAAHELPAGMDQHLADDLAAIAAARDEQETEREGGVASTATVGQLIAAGMKEVNYLDVIVNNKYTRTPDKLRTWQSASHIERPAQREKKPAPPPAPPAPPKP
jgi:hypothetical protein